MKKVGIDMLYVYIHPDGNDTLFGVAEESFSFEAPTFFEAMKIEPEFVAYSVGTLKFKDKIVTIKDAE